MTAKKIKVPEKLRSFKTLPATKFIMYDPDEPEYPNYTTNPAAHAVAIREGGTKEFYRVGPVFIGSADYHNRVWTEHSSNKRFISAGEVLEYLMDTGAAMGQTDLQPGTYTASYASCSLQEDRVILTQANGKQIIIKKS